MNEFNKLISKPIVMYLGDFIGEEPSNELGKENWCTRLTLGGLFVKAVNRHGGDATLVELHKISIYATPTSRCPTSIMSRLPISYPIG